MRSFRSKWVTLLVFATAFVSINLLPTYVFGFAETFYVSADGNGTDPTSDNAATAWTAADVSNSANWSTAANTVDGKIGPGDRIYFLSIDGAITGSGATGSAIITIRGSGVAGSPITLQGDGNAVIDGQNTYVDITGDTKNYIVIDDLKISNGYQFNVTTWMCNYWTIENSQIWGAYQTSTYNGTDIGASGSNFLVQNNDIYDATGQHGLYFFEGTSGAPSNNNIIQYNNFHDNSEDGIHLNGTSPAFTGNIIRYNTFTNNAWAAIEDQSGDGTQIYGNILIMTESPYHEGIVINGDGNGVNPTNTKIYNNTIYGSFEVMLYIGVGNGTGGVASVDNNIFYQTGGGGGNYFIYRGPNGSLGASDYNQFYDSQSSDANRFYWAGGSDQSPDSLSAWQTETGFDSHSADTNPLFVNPGTDFHLQAGSPCINTGTNVGLTVDRAQTTIPQGGAPDKGAFEYVPPATRPAAPTGLRVLP